MKNKIKRVSAMLAMVMALTAFGSVSVFAEGNHTLQNPHGAVAVNESQITPTSTPSPTPAPTSNSYLVSSYEVSNIREGGNLWAQTEHADVTFWFTSSQDESGLTARMINTGSFTGDGSSVSVESQGKNHKVTFSNVTYNGGGTSMQIEVTSPSQGVGSFSQEIAQCHDVNPYATPAPTEAPAATEKPEKDYPKILVKDFSFGGTSVEAGKEFVLDLTLFTTSGDANLQDVMVGLNFGEMKGVTLASGSMNTYVGDMAPNTTKNISFKMATDATIEAGAISISVNLTSKNGEAATSPISIPVTQPERFDITNMEAPETMMMGEEGYISVTFVNKGKSAINNLSAEIQGENIANPGQSQFLGNIAAGTENSVDFNVAASKEGIIKGKVILSYEDAKGEVKTLEKEFSCTVEPMPQMDDSMNGMNPQMDDAMNNEVQSGMPIWGWVLIIVGAAAVICVVVVVIKKKQKAKKLAQLEAEEEEEDEAI